MIKMKEKNFLSVVCYVHDNEDAVEEFFSKTYPIFRDHFEKFEMICVNDASCDDSISHIKKLADKMPEAVVSIVNMSYYQGLEAAMNAGVDLAIGDFVFEFDTCKLTYAPELIMDVYNKALSGYDIVAASNPKKRFFSSVFYRLYNRNADTQYALGSETFRILSRRAINRVHAMSKTLPYRKALYANCGLKSCAISYEPIREATYKGTKQDRKNREETALNVLILFTNVAYKISILIAILMILATLATAVYVVAIFALQRPVSGFTPIMLVMTGSFFGVFSILAIVIKYLSVIIDLVFKRQKYIVESVEKIR